MNLSIELGSDPITGSVSSGAHRSQPFTGWIELVAAIEEVRISERSPNRSETTLGRAGQTLGVLPGAKASEL